ncbi:MAG: hypothetical protein ACRDQB_05185, partial [Thermocrispum sp.]
MQPSHELLGHRARCAQEFLPGEHLADHEVAEELVELIHDVGSTHLGAEGVFVTVVVGLSPAVVVRAGQHGGAVAAQA